MSASLHYPSLYDIPIDPDLSELRSVELEDAEIASSITLDDLTSLLVSPDDQTPLIFRNGELKSQSGYVYPIRAGAPLLLPQQVISYIRNDMLDVSLSDVRNALDQYLYLNIVKNSGWDANSPHNDPWYLRHLHRSRNLVSDATGLVLDVGCDEPEISRRIFPPSVRYVGLEPSLDQRSGLRIVGMAEFLPLATASVDAVAFMTSLDHILDYHTALDEAYRVLKPGGALYLVTLIWTEHAQLYKDNIHFHHFRDFEIQGALRRFHISKAKRYNWKNDTHRSAFYLKGTKPK